MCIRDSNVSVEGLGLKSDTASGISTATSAGISTATNEEVPNLKINQVNEDSTITIKSNLSTITFDGKTFPKGLSGPMETFGGKGGSTYGESEFYQDFIGKTDTNNDITNLNPSKKKKIVTVPINTGGSNTVPAGNGSSSTEEETIIVVDNTLTAVNQINTQFT